MLNSYVMNYYPGGKQPLRQAKGMKLVLDERGIDTTGMKANEMRDILKGEIQFRVSHRILDKIKTAHHHYNDIMF